MPPGLRYFGNWLETEEAAAALREIEAYEEAAWKEIVFRGVLAKRRAVYFGHDYDTIKRTSNSAGPMPAWLTALARRAEAEAGLDGESLAAALIWRYPAGAGIGWHRDAPAFGNTVVSISLGAAGRLQFRRGDSGGAEYEVELGPGSLVIIQDEARYEWRHRVVPVKAERYSITMRNLRAD